MVKDADFPDGMMQQIQQMQAQVLKAQNVLAEETVTGSAGGGAVVVTITGGQQCRAVEIDPELLQEPDAEMLGDLVLTAFNNALEESRQLALKRLGPLSGGLSP